MSVFIKGSKRAKRSTASNILAASNETTSTRDFSKVKIGNLNIKNIKIGDKQVNAVYIGSKKIV